MNNMELIPLIKGFQSGNREQFDSIYIVFEKLLYHYARLLKDEDLLQELNVFLIELINNISLDKFCADDSVDLKKYIAVSIRNKYISYSKAKQMHEALFVGFCEEIASDNDVSNDFESNMALFEGFSRLTKRQRQVIIYKYVYDYSDVEISKFLHISRQAVNRLKTRGLIILRDFLKNE